jgi:hypothetical protein
VLHCAVPNYAQKVNMASTPASCSESVPPQVTNAQTSLFDHVVEYDQTILEYLLSCNQEVTTLQDSLARCRLNRDNCWWVVDSLPSVLRTCLEHGGSECANVLVDHFQLTVNDVRQDGPYVLSRLARKGHLDSLQYFVKKFQLTADDARFHNNCALGEAVERGHLDILDYLVDHFELTADDVIGSHGNTISSAATNGHLEVVTYLVDRFPQAASHMHMHRNWNPSHVANKGHVEVVKYLVAHGGYARSEVSSLPFNMTSQQLEDILACCVQDEDQAMSLPLGGVVITNFILLALCALSSSVVG